MSQVLTFAELVSEVGPWSQSNFGDQDGLNEAAPLLGVVEEIMCELREASSIADRRDAFADAVIFLADTFYRLGLPTDRLSWSDRREGRLTQAIGAAAHVVLKRRQGIRDIAIHDVAVELGDLFQILVNRYYQILGDHVALEDLVFRTWERVKQRNWKKNPSDAHEVAAETAQ